jgi:PAS domain S-box-containing protein
MPFALYKSNTLFTASYQGPEGSRIYYGSTVKLREKRKMLNTLPRELLYQKIGEASSDAFIVSDQNGVIRLWSSGAEAMFGFQSREAVGRSLDLIMPEKRNVRHREGRGTEMETGAAGYAAKLLSTPAVCKDGSSIYVEFSKALIRDGAGELLGTAAIIRDVTTRWQREKVWKDRLSYLEGLRFLAAKGGTDGWGE